MRIETLEERALLAASPPYTPDQLRAAYGVDHIQFGSTPITGDGAGQTIAIIDSGDDPNIVADLTFFDQNLFLGSTVNLDTFGSYAGPVVGSTQPWFNKIVVPGTSPGTLSASLEQNLAGETSLDVEWAHVIAPLANILLVETDTGLGKIEAAAQYAATQPGVSVVSMSYGFMEPATTADDANFTAANVTFVASTGDHGSALLGHTDRSPEQFPAGSPNVVAAGGTNLKLNNDGSYLSETGWSFRALSQNLNNGSAAYSQSGTWTAQTGGFSGGYSTAAGGSSSTATWTSTIANTDKDGAGFTEVSATWVASAGNANNATFKIYDNGVLLATDSIDQTLAPIGTSKSGTFFQELGDFKFPTGDTVTVVLDASSSGGTVVADAIGLARGGATGGDFSMLENQPSYQAGLTLGGAHRTTPDVAMEADPNTGVLVYDTYNPTAAAGFNSTGQSGGTSLAAPCWAALVAIADQGLANAGQGLLSSATTLAGLYSLPVFDFHDVTSGYNGYAAGPGYDLVTGRGSPLANQLIIELANTVGPVSGPLNYEAPEGSGSNDLRLVLSGTTINLFDNGTLVDSRPQSNTTAINVFGANNTNDSLTVDFSGGNPIPLGGLSFDGGTGGANDVLVLTAQLPGGPWASEVSTPTGPHSGGITFNGTTTITYSNLKPIVDLTPATNVTYNATNNDEQINIVQGPLVGATQTIEVNSSTSTFELVDFANKTHVTVNGLNGNDKYVFGNGDLDAIPLAIAIADTGGVADSIVLNDGANSKLADYSVNGTGVTTQFSSGTARSFLGVSYPSGVIESLTLNATTGANTIHITPDVTMTFNINGNSPTFSGPGGDLLDVNFTGTKGRKLTYSGPPLGNGKWEFLGSGSPLTGVRQPINFTSIEKFNYFAISVVGADAGYNSQPLVQVYDAETGDLLSQFLAYEPKYKGGVRVASGDINGDGIPEIVTAPGDDHAPVVKIFDILSSTEKSEFLADTSYWRSGLQLAVGDVTGDGKNDIATGADWGPAVVHVFANTGNASAPFNNYSRFAIGATPATPSFDAFNDYWSYGAGVGGLAIGNVLRHTNGVGDIVVTAGIVGQPVVRVFDYFDLGASKKFAKQIVPFKPNWWAFGPLSVAVGNIDSASGYADIVVGAGFYADSEVAVWHNDSGSITRFTAYTGRGDDAPLRVAIQHIGATAEIFTAQGPGGKSHQIRKFTPSGVLVDFILETDPAFAKGIWLG